MIRRTRWYPLNPLIFDVSKIWFAVPADFHLIRWFPLVSPKFSLSAVSEFADEEPRLKRREIVWWLNNTFIFV
jgi:hypothetical protein